MFDFEAAMEEPMEAPIEAPIDAPIDAPSDVPMDATEPPKHEVDTAMPSVNCASDKSKLLMSHMAS